MSDEYSNMTTEQLEKLLEEKENEAQMWHTRQMALKISLNSCYGSLGNPHSRYFDVRIAESITMSGQLAIRWIANKLNEFMNNLIGTESVDYVIAIDTDSNYLNLAEVIKKKGLTDKQECVEFLDQFSKKLEKIIDKFYQELAEYMNSFDQNMVMEREAIADRAFWVAKKRYAMQVWDMEGTRFEDPMLKIMGLETQRSSTPKVCRDQIKEAIRLILTSDEEHVLSFMKSFEAEYYKMTPQEIAFPSGINNLTDYQRRAQNGSFASGTPIHVKAAISYNRLVREKKLTTKYELIKDGDKIKYIYLRQPNPIQNNAIAFTTNLPPEFELDKYVDTAKMFEKSFEEPVKRILRIIGWREEIRTSIEDMF